MDGGEVGDEEEEEERPVIEIKTASYDARFPATNQVSITNPRRFCTLHARSRPLKAPQLCPVRVPWHLQPPGRGCSVQASTS